MKALARTSITSRALAFACLASFELFPARASGQDKGVAAASTGAEVGARQELPAGEIVAKVEMKTCS